MSKLSTHVLNTMSGTPAAGIQIKLFRSQKQSFELIKQTNTNECGRCNEPLLQGNDFTNGCYQIEFDVQGYFANLGVATPFLKDVVIRFYVDDCTKNYHVPILISPYSYSTYRGS